MVCIEAPAKINLHLDIRSPRSDGYHDLLSIFQTVSLFDTICVSPSNEKGKCRIEGDFSVPEKENLIHKAYELYALTAGIESGIDVRVTKRIPEGAGLGGGSSDAAAALLCMETLFQKPLSSTQMEECCLALGSDVYFFLESAAAIVSGRGEITRPLSPRMDYDLLIVYPGFSISTKAAYALLDSERNKRDTHYKAIDPSYLIETYERKPISQWKYFNSFSEALEKRYPLLSSVMNKLRSLGSEYTNITGSGSAVIALFTPGAITEDEYNRLKSEYTSVFYVKPLDKNPLPVVK